MRGRRRFAWRRPRAYCIFTDGCKGKTMSLLDGAEPWTDSDINERSLFRTQRLEATAVGMHAYEKELRDGPSPERAASRLCALCYYFVPRATARIEDATERQRYRRVFPCRNCKGQVEQEPYSFSIMCFLCADQRSLCVHCGGRR